MHENTAGVNPARRSDCYPDWVEAGKKKMIQEQKGRNTV
jgi:hypothetical protein